MRKPDRLSRTYDTCRDAMASDVPCNATLRNVLNGCEAWPIRVEDAGDFLFSTTDVSEALVEFGRVNAAWPAHLPVNSKNCQKVTKYLQ